MKIIDTLPRRTLIIEQHYREHAALMESVCSGMTRDQRRIVEGVVNHFHPLVEYALTQDQINQVFGAVEQGVTASGTNRTALGKSKDVGAAANKIVNDAGRWLQDTAPVKAFDNQFEKLKLNLKDKLGTTPAGQKTLKLVQNLGDYAKENPAKTAFVIGVLTAVAAVATGPVGGAIAGQVLRGSMELAKGEKFSTAVGKGIKTAAIGAAAGAVADLIGDLVDPEIVQQIISPDGSTIDVSSLEAMADGVSVEDLEPEDIKALLQTQNALEAAYKGATEIPAEDREFILSQFDEVSQKINELGGVEELANSAGLEQGDIDINTFTDGVITDTTVISGEDLQKTGINFNTEPPISDEAIAFAEEHGIDPDTLQRYFQMEKAMMDAEFMGTEVSSTSELSAFVNDNGITVEGIPEKLVSGEVLNLEVTTRLPGIDQPVGFTSQVQISGIDTDGNAVFEVQEVVAFPDNPAQEEIFSQLDKLDIDVDDKVEPMRSYAATRSGGGPRVGDVFGDTPMNTLRELLQKYAGEGVETSSIKELKDTFNQKLAQSIGAAATVAATSAALADKKVQTKDQAKTESRIPLLMMKVAYLSERQRLDEISLSSIKQQAAKIAQKGAAKAAEIGKNMTTRVTASKLMKAWKDAGSPTDSAQILALLDREGIDTGITQQAFKDSGLEVPQQDQSQVQATDIQNQVNRIKELLAKAQEQTESILSEALSDEERAELQKLIQAVGSAQDVPDELKQEIETLTTQAQTVLQQPAQQQTVDPAAAEPVDTANDTFDVAVQKYLQAKGLARGGLTYAVLPDILKVNNYASPEQWLKNAGIRGKNPGTVVSKADLENLAAYLKQNAGAMGTEAPQAQQTQINIADYAAKLKADPKLAAQVKAYLQQGNTQ